MKALWLAALPICVSLSIDGAAAEQATAPAAVAAEAAPAVVCKRFAEPGTLIRKRKICLTRSEWARLSEAAQRNLEQLQVNNLGGADGCKPGAPGC
jgi:hypothetical protein